MSEQRDIATFFLSGHVDRDAVAYVQRRLGATRLPRDHTMVWIDKHGPQVRVAIEYDLGHDRFCAEARGVEIVPVTNECVDELLWKVSGGRRAVQRVQPRRGVIRR